MSNPPTRDFGGPSFDPIEGDPDLGDLSVPALEDNEPGNDLQAIAAELAAETGTRPSTINIDGRPGWSATYRTDFTLKDVELLRAKSKDRAFKESKVDPAKMAGLLLATTCTAIQRGGRNIELDGKCPVTFGSPEFQDAMGTRGLGVLGTIRKVFGQSDPRIIAVSDKLMSEAGWDDEATLADPTE